MKKKIISVLITVILLFALTTAVEISANALTYDIYTYTVSNGGVTITDCQTDASGDIVIPDTIEGYPVTAIGKQAFHNCRSITSITMPDTVLSIGEEAFWQCTSLKSINLPYGLTTIKTMTFRNCNMLENITLPDSVTSIEKSAFCYCSSLKSVNIPEGVTTLGFQTFYQCESLEEVSFPEGLVSIGEDAFAHCSSLKNVKLPSTLHILGATAFYGCESITSIFFSKVLQPYKYNTFQYCDSLERVYYEGTKDEWTTIWKKGDCREIDNAVLYTDVTSFEFDGHLEYAIIGDQAVVTKCDTTVQGIIEVPATLGGCPVTEISDRAFSECSSITEIVLPDSVTVIGNSAFSGCALLEKIDLSNSLISIGKYAFSNCKVLTNVTLPNGTESIGEFAFSQCDGLVTVVLPGSLNSIGRYAFYKCVALTDVKIPSSLETIEYSAFSGCTALKSVEICDGVKNIGENAFYNCASLTDIIIPDSVSSIEQYAFQKCSALTGIILPNSITSIGRSTFYDCDALEYIVMPVSVTKVNESAFKYCNSLNTIYYGGTVDEWSSINVYSDNDSFEDATVYYNSRYCNDIIYTVNDEKVTIVKYTKKADGMLEIPGELGGYPVTAIGNNVFKDNTSLTDLIIPDTVTSIGDSAFTGCTSLENIYYSGSEEDWSTIVVGTENDVLTSVQVKYNTSYYGSLEYTIIDGNAVITNCLKDESGTLEIPQTLGGCPVTEIAQMAFSGCYFTSISIPDTVKKIGASAFAYCGLLDNVVLPSGVEEICDSTFEGCATLKNITIPETVKTIGKYAFKLCGFERITIPKSVECIGEYAFDGCDLLLYVYITDIEAWCNITFENPQASPFYYADTLYLNGAMPMELIIPDSITEIKNYAFNGCLSINSVEIPESVTKIGSYAFFDCTTLETVIMADSVKIIEKDAFGNCRYITTVNYGGTKDDWNEIEIGENNESLTGAEITYYVPPSNPVRFPQGSSVVQTEPEEDKDEGWKHTFVDVVTTDWFSEAVNFVAQNDYFNGVSENEFGPSEKMTRAMLVTVIARIAGADVSGATNTFDDVETNSWYGGFVAWAARNNLIGGVGNGIFAPNNNVTREQIAAILMRYAAYKGYSTDITSTEVYDSMSDTDKVSSYAVDAMQWATSYGIINGSNGRLNPNGFATRSEVAQMIMNFCNTFNV